MSESGTKAGCNCGCMGAGPMLTQFLRTLGPSDQVSQHFRNAQLEMMKGLRAFLDEQIAARSTTRGPAPGTRITVE
ncbi:MAG TPA: hypothetical protein VM032_02235 [Vicinamibacterales bacterium]|nr:hypothetical protein [Vicinamibacterales bacterium]